MANNYRTYHDDPYYGFTDEYSYYFDDGLNLNDIPLSDPEDREEYETNNDHDLVFNQDEYPIDKYSVSLELITIVMQVITIVLLLHTLYTFAV